MSDAQRELAELMKSYINRYQKINEERDEAKAEGNYDAVETLDAMKRQVSIMIAELYKVQKRLGYIEDDDYVLP